MLNKTGYFAPKEGSGRRNSIRTKENLQLEEEIILNQEDQPGTHWTPAQIALEVILIVDYHPDQDLDFCPLRKRKFQKPIDSNIEKRMVCQRKLLTKHTQKTLQTAFFNDEKIIKYLRLNNSIYHICGYITQDMVSLSINQSINSNLFI